MPQNVTHRAELEKLRDHLREERRKLVHRLATARQMPKTFATLISLQRAFEAAERAIQDEIVAEPTTEVQPPKGRPSELEG